NRGTTSFKMGRSLGLGVSCLVECCPCTYERLFGPGFTSGVCISKKGALLVQRSLFNRKNRPNHLYLRPTCMVLQMGIWESESPGDEKRNLELYRRKKSENHNYRTH